MDQLYEIELLGIVPFPDNDSLRGTDFGPFVFGPDRTKLYSKVSSQHRILEVDVEGLEPRMIDLEIDGPVRTNRMVVDGAHNWAIVDLRKGTMLILNREFKLVKRVSFDIDKPVVPTDIIGVQSGGFIVSTMSPGVLSVLKLDTNGDADWTCVVTRNSQRFAGSTNLYYGSDENCFLLARALDTSVVRLDKVSVIRCDARGSNESPAIFYLESPSIPAPSFFLGKMRTISESHEFTGAVMALGAEGGALLRCGIRAYKQPVLVRYVAGEEPRAYRLPYDVHELLPFDDNSFWGRPSGHKRSDILAFRFRIPPWEAGLPFSKFNVGRF